MAQTGDGPLITAQAARNIEQEAETSPAYLQARHRPAWRARRSVDTANSQFFLMFLVPGGGSSS